MSSNKELFRIEPSDQEPEVISVEEAPDNTDLYHTAGAQDPKGDTATNTADVEAMLNVQHSFN